jgi:PAS domain S-box-containing protein
MEIEFSRVIDALPGLVWTALPDGQADFLNRRWLEYTGLTTEAALGVGWLAVVHPDDAEGLADYWRGRLGVGEAGETEARLRRVDGIYRWFHFRTAPVTDAAGRIVKWCGINTDIEDRKRAEADVREHERRFRSIVEGLPAIVTLMTPEGEFAYGNQHMIDYLGAPFDELKKRPTTQSFHPDDRPEVDRRWKHSIESGEPYDHEARLKGGDGVYRWFHTRGFPLRDPDGNIALWYLLQENIDERRRADEEMRASERNARAIVDGFPGLVAVFSADGFAEQVNQQMLTFWGKSWDQLKDWAAADLFHPEDVPRLLEAFFKAFKAKSDFEIEVRARRFDGVYRWLLSRGIPVKDATGRIVRWYNLLIDIDERKRTEDVLAASARNLKLIIDTTPALMWSSTPDGNTESVNQHFLDYVGMTWDELRGQTWALAIHPDDQDALTDVWAELRATGQPGETEARIRRHDGEYRWFLLRANPLRDETGKIIKWYGVNTDIEDRKRAEETLSAREREQKRVIDTTPALIWSTNPKGRIDSVNQHYVDYVGLPLEQMPGEGWEIIHPDDLERLSDTWKAIIASGETGQTEARLRRRDGQYRWFLFRASPMRDESGKIVRWYGVNTDIEDRKQAEEAVAASERNLRQTVNTIPALVFCNRADGPNEYLNQRWHDYTGLSPEQARSGGWRTPIHPEDLPRMMEKWMAMLAAGESGEVEGRLRRFDGEYRRFLFRTDALRDEAGKIVKWYGTITDIEDLKRAEAELRHAHSLLTEAQRLSRTGSFTWDVLADEHNWSEEIYRIFEFDPASKVTMPMIQAAVHPEDVATVERVIGGAATGHDFDLVFRIVTGSGAVRHARVVAHRIAHIEEERPVFIGALQDITDNKVAEEALSKARSELAHVSRVSALGALTASIAHEVNQPLAGIVTNASTCLRMLGGNPPNIDGARETARRTIRDGNRAAEVITRLRALFGKKETRFELIDVNEAAREVAALSLNELQRSRIVLRQEYADDLPTVAGDRVQLQQVILNLILNATDAMSEIGDRPRLLTIKTELDEDDQVRLSVQDSGVGLDPLGAAKMFDAFYTTKPGGMGIGLLVSRSIIDRHQGRLWARSNDGPGATFSFAIPKATDPLVESATVRTPGTHAAQETRPH